ncbi:MAG: YggS family pyridoxal phosphate-dependent enzyme [Chloroflexi bacterium]|nr:YggS family pyridoxal phosphate-dependent enzyme [Chloroflexota bacterium]
MISDNVRRVENAIIRACERAGRDPAAVTLVAVSKTKPAAQVIGAYAAGVRHFGENRVEEANAKIVAVNAELGTAPIWHMIGHIQSRKARDVVAYQGQRLFGLVHSIDGTPLAAKLDRAVSLTGGTPLPWLAQVNVSGEASKSGFEGQGWERESAVLDTLVAQLREAAALPGLELRGLMTMAPIVDDAEAVRPVFRSLAGLRGALEQRLGMALPELSMGMTDDYEVAVEEGATIVRVGRAIFGER